MDVLIHDISMFCVSYWFIIPTICLWSHRRIYETVETRWWVTNNNLYGNHKNYKTYFLAFQGTNPVYLNISNRTFRTSRAISRTFNDSIIHQVIFELPFCHLSHLTWTLTAKPTLTTLPKSNFRELFQNDSEKPDCIFFVWGNLSWSLSLVNHSFQRIKS